MSNNTDNIPEKDYMANAEKELRFKDGFIDNSSFIEKLNISEELYKRHCKGEFRENISFNFIPDYYVGYDLPHITITAKKLQITPKLYSMFIELIEKIHKECGGVNYE